MIMKGDEYLSDSAQEIHTVSTLFNQLASHVCFLTYRHGTFIQGSLLSYILDLCGLRSVCRTGCRSPVHEQLADVSLTVCAYGKK